MDEVRHLIVGAGISGLATAAFLSDKDYLVLEADREIGGYCKTVKKEGFVWDYSGHFFHFKNPDIEAYLRARMPGQNILTVEKLSYIAHPTASSEGASKWIDFPFQKNIHQLPHDEFIDCLYDLYFARTSGEKLPETNFKEMLYARFGRSIAEKFLIPYNEKLYATDLGKLDKDAMGRFFPHADLTDIIRNMKVANNATYNASFTYPEGGAIEYVKALASEVDPKRLALEESLLSIDLKRRVARTNKRDIKFERLVSSAPFPKLLQMTGLPHDKSAFSWNKVLVFNLGFDKKGRSGVHWAYFPNRERVFYRLGWYDNIFNADRLSLYVEIGFPADATVDVEANKQRVLEDLRKEGVITDHKLVADHHVVMDPAYVHITRASNAELVRARRVLAAHGVYSIGRYGGWTYCSIEDNILEARALANDFNATA